MQYVVRLVASGPVTRRALRVRQMHFCASRHMHARCIHRVRQPHVLHLLLPNEAACKHCCGAILAETQAFDVRVRGNALRFGCGGHLLNAHGAPAAAAASC